MANSPIPVGDTLAGKYRIERVLGEGGMGVVVLAHHLELDQPVAIKFLLEGVAEHEEGAERFRREARAAAKIHSDHVVRVLDVGIMDDGVRYMVMEYLEGRDLSEELTERRSFPIGVACGFILEAIDAVAQAHAVGIVHRDLKPANLFLAQRPDGSQRIKVLDFGISKTIGATTSEQLSLTKTSAWIGSPLYMAPEQMQSARDVDSRADIWSLGAILYELIAGVPPYEAESLPQLCNLLITTDAPPIQSKNPMVPDDLAATIMGCLVRDKEQRTQTATDLARGIARYATTITGSGMSAGRLSLLDRTEMASGNYSTVPSMPGSMVPGSMMPGSMVPGSLSGGSDRPSHVSPISGAATVASVGSGTHAAWGNTDNGTKRSSPALFLLAAAAVVIVGGIFVFVATSGGAAPVEDTAMVAAPAPEAPAPVAVPDPEPAAAPVPEDEIEPEAVEPAIKAAEPAPAPVPTPAPVARPNPRPVAKPAPAPAEAPAPAPGDEFSDFGGRR